MSLILPENFSAIKILKEEHFDLSGCNRSIALKVRPLRLAILNLMPLKLETEVDLLRILAQSPYQIEVTWMSLGTYVPKHTPREHMEAFYTPFPMLKQHKFDALIITGAPVEHMDFEDVAYWPELTDIMMWARTHVTSVLYICWAAQAGLHFHYGIPKYTLPEKMFGVYEHRVTDPGNPLFLGMDDFFFMPHSRYTEVHHEDIARIEDLKILAESNESGVAMVMARNGRDLFVTGHSEYGPLTLDAEYWRDLSRGLNIRQPVNYYRDNDPEQGPIVRWRSHGVLWMLNWLRYFVYEVTPYNLNDIK